jgi:hypothetical protein
MGRYTQYVIPHAMGRYTQHVIPHAMGRYTHEFRGDIAERDKATYVLHSEECPGFASRHFFFEAK